MASIFLSYKHIAPDDQVAAYLYETLKDLGHRVFLDRVSLEPGMRWHEVIQRRISDADWFIPLISASFVYSVTPYIRDHEVGAVLRRLEGSSAPSVLPIILAFAGDYPEPMGRLVGEIQRIEWRSPDDTARVARDVERVIPAPHGLIKGMEFFDEPDGERFRDLGREAEVESFLSLVRTTPHPFLLVQGPSGVGKTSFLRAGIVPALGVDRVARPGFDEQAPWPDGPDAAEDAAYALLDPFEDWLTWLDADPSRSAGFLERLEGRMARGRLARVIFCVRQGEGRTAFDKHLAPILTRCETFGLLPFSGEVAARVLGRLLDDAGVEADDATLRALCAELEEGLPRGVIPAPLQLIAQSYRERRSRGLGSRLTLGEWRSVLNRGQTLFEEHVRSSVLGHLPWSLPEVKATRCLRALTRAEVKSPPRTAAEVAAESGTSPAECLDVLTLASRPRARCVVAEGTSGETIYHLSHNLFAAAIHRLHVEAERRSRLRLRTVASTAFGALTVMAGTLGWVALDNSRKARAVQSALARYVQSSESGPYRLPPFRAELPEGAAGEGIPALTLESAYKLALARSRSGRGQPDGGRLAALDPGRVAEHLARTNAGDYALFVRDFLAAGRDDAGSDGRFRDPGPDFLGVLGAQFRAENARRQMDAIGRYFQIASELAKGAGSGVSQKQIDDVFAARERARLAYAKALPNYLNALDGLKHRIGVRPDAALMPDRSHLEAFRVAFVSFENWANDPEREFGDLEVLARQLPIFDEVTIGGRGVIATIGGDAEEQAALLSEAVAEAVRNIPGGLVAREPGFEAELSLRVRSRVRALQELQQIYVARARLYLLAIRRQDQSIESLLAPPMAGRPDLSLAVAYSVDAYVNAQEELFQSQSNLVDLWVDYQSERLRLYRDLGTLPRADWTSFAGLFVPRLPAADDPEGRSYLQEALPPPAAVADPAIADLPPVPDAGPPPPPDPIGPPQH